MSDTTLAERVIELEMRIAFQDATIEALSSELKAQQKHLEQLAKQLETVRAFLTTPSTTDSTHTKPPHY